jgi:1-acyl-sn-glycerol-3-phosphate acyltransferase
VKYVTRLLHGLWGLYSWLIFLLCILFSLLVVTIVPTEVWRHRLTTGAARALFVLTGVGATVTGLEHIPDGHCVVVANHASYIDGFLLRGYLPARFSFVIKGEMRDIPFVHFLLRRAGARFVERFSTVGSSRDARQIVKAAQDGQALAFFPEGTFIKQVGVSRFRPGAFVAAIKGEMPVVPAAIFGTRYMMPAGRLLPRPCRLRIEFCPAITTDDPAFQSSRQLAEAARRSVLSILNEPDLLEIDDERPHSSLPAQETIQ